MHPGIHAEKEPDKVACRFEPSGVTLTYRELNERSMQGAQLFHALGLRFGDHIAFCLQNDEHFHPLCWAAQRSGLYYTAISTRLSAPEVEYIVGDCDARVFITTQRLGKLATEMASCCPKLLARYTVHGDVPGFERFEEALAAQPAVPLAEELEGAPMLYSSGTTGRPKGVKHPLVRAPLGDAPALARAVGGIYQMDESTRYLSPAPLYHSAPLAFTMSLLRIGATVMVMEKFDAQDALRIIETQRITHAQWVPTMFVRMLKLPEPERARYDTSSLRFAIHAAAPCPVPVKQQMIAWWGPVLFEYYAGTEGQGFVMIDSKQWLENPGSVGQPLGCSVHILNDDFEELPPGEIGGIYFESNTHYEYHKAPEKTADAQSPQGWSTLGDVGYLSETGYLYLTDRRAFMIISGGVNIYPQETENCLITHPKVADVAVFGVPSEAFGEEVKAVVQPLRMADAGPELEQALINWCREQIADLKCPRSVDFMEELPRHPTGKLYKRLLKDRYWGNKTSRIV